MIAIAPFAEKHLPGVVDVILPIQQAEFNIPISLEAQPDLLDIPGFYQKNNGNFWVALQGNEVVGTVALLDIGRGPGALRKMFVKKPFRGLHGVLRQNFSMSFWIGANREACRSSIWERHPHFWRPIVFTKRTDSRSYTKTICRNRSPLCPSTRSSTVTLSITGP
jgi:hypothetical protein